MQEIITCDCGYRNRTKDGAMCKGCGKPLPSPSWHAAGDGSLDLLDGRLREEWASRGLTLATLCDLVLGENAADRSDAALVRAVAELVRRKPSIGRHEPRRE